MTHPTNEDRLRNYICELSEQEVRKQLFLCFCQMERCISLLHGDKKVKPVEMADNGLSTDLELFYTCKRAVDGQLPIKNTKLKKIKK